MNSAQSTHQLVAAVSGQLPHWRAVSPVASRSPNAASATLSARKWFSIMLLGLHMTWQDGQTTAPLLSPANKTISFVKSVHLSFSLKPPPHTFSLSARKWSTVQTWCPTSMSSRTQLAYLVTVWVQPVWDYCNWIVPVRETILRNVKKLKLREK